MKLKKLICVLVCFLGITLIFEGSHALSYGSSLSGQDKDYLIGLFQETGFDKDYLKEVFSDPRLKYMPGITRRNVINREDAVNYEQFLSPVAIGMARKFARRWRTRLANASRDFGVDKEIIVAILLVETSLGGCLGDDNIMSVYASIILDNHGMRRKDMEKTFGRASSGSKNLKRLHNKARWARGEIAALLKMKRDMDINIYELRGSYAGAFGIPQFLPTSYIRWGHDGDSSETVDLFYIPDAIVSVVSYLKGHGWKKGLHNKENERVLRRYNNSSVYVKTVLEIAKKL
ncbi:MAG: lytic murein transglycosylase [Syntrophales bacterium]|nr:lytic murein transglycosylase [Syntrophales bacterium]